MKLLARFAFIVGLLTGSAACNDCTSLAAEREAIPNIRLGMAPRDVRDRFQPSGEGSWQTMLGPGGDNVLEWTARSPASPLLSARFEFHLGMLVAMRGRSAEGSTRERITLTPKTVTIRAPLPEGGTQITVLARDCPTHKEEAESFAAKAARSP